MFAASKTDSVSGGPPDDKFNYVTMLLHGDGTNGAQNNTFLDSSTNNFSITRNGNTTQGSFSPYGSNWSNAFDGDASGDNLIAVSANTANAMGTGDWTAEAWIFLNVGGLTPFVFDTLPTSSGSATGLRMRLNASNQLQLWQYSSAVLTSSTAVSVGAWTHVALVKSSGTTTAYINGTASNTYSDSGNYICGTNRPMIGSDGFNNGSENTLNGYISNLRLVKGTAVYTGNFTPSTTNLTAVSGTSLLACQDNRFKDNSSNNFTLTANGTPTVQRFNPFGTSTAYSTSVIGGSGYFDGSGDYLNTPGSTDWNLGSNNFTIESWVYPTASPAQPMIIGQWTSSYAWTMQLSNDGNRYLRALLYNGSFNDYVSSTSLQLNAWNHCAFVRESNTVSLYLNGARVFTTTFTGSVSNSTAAVSVGADSSGGQPLQGYITNSRVVNGTALYSGTTYTVPTAPLSAVTNTKLLLNMTNGAIFDNAMMNDLETVGSAQISTSVTKFGTGSISLSASGNTLRTQYSNPSLSIGTGNFTIEGWVYFSSTPSTNGVFQMSGTSGGFAPNQSANLALATNNSTSWQIYAKNTFTISSTTSIAVGSWIHFALVRSGTTTVLYINGTALITLTSDSTNYSTPYIGLGAIYDATSYPLGGYIDDLRITNGFARYTANFTASTAAFSDTGPY